MPRGSPRTLADLVLVHRRWATALHALTCGGLVGGLVACDLPPAAATPRPIHGRVVAPLDGLLARDGRVEIELDDLVEPSSLFGADASLTSGDRQLGVSLAFDPARRILTADPTARLLDPDLDYTLRVTGPRSFAGGPLEPVEARLRVVRTLAVPQLPPSFAEVEEALAPCGSCHEGPTAALGFDVTDLAGTGIGVPAAEVRDASTARGLWGTQRIEPGHPERSYLVYKLLGEGPIVGAPMGVGDDAAEPLSPASIELVSRWIAAGASVAPRERP